MESFKYKTQRTITIQIIYRRFAAHQIRSCMPLYYGPAPRYAQKISRVSLEQVRSAKSLHHQTMEQVRSAKYLGLTITDDLERGQHISEISCKATYRRWTKVFVTFENSIDFNVFSCLEETLSCLFWSTYFHDFGVI